METKQCHLCHVRPVQRCRLGFLEALVLVHLCFSTFLQDADAFHVAVGPSKQAHRLRNLETLVLKSTTSSHSPTSVHTAIMLNLNAGGVSRQLIPIAEEVFGKECVYVTTSEDEAKHTASLLVEKNVSMVIPVGGDGTLSSIINFLSDATMKKHNYPTVEEAMKVLPLVGYIPLGTGNGIGSVVGFPPKTRNPFRLLSRRNRKLGHLEQLMRSLHAVGKDLHENEENSLADMDDADIVELPMIQLSFKDSDVEDEEVHRELCFFAGVGFDSLMLQDFKDIKKWSIRTGFLTRFLSSVAGYSVALVVKTLPQCVLRRAHRIHVEVSSSDPEALWIDHRRGDLAQKLSQSDGRPNVYQGHTGILAAGTSPFYGGGLRLFPFARVSNDKMHLRLGRINPLLGFINIPRIFAGTYRDKRPETFGCLDFLGGEFDVRVQGPSNNSGYPLQHSGEVAGVCNRFQLRVVKEPVRFVSFLRKRITAE